MLFVGCSRCQSIGPFMCGGTFGFHPPIPAEPSPMGPFCPMCGPMAPMFMCGVCGTMQGLYMSGMASPPQQQMGAASLVAPVVNASPAASHGQIQDLLKSFAGDCARSAGKSFGQSLGQAMGAWVT
jgi:hypothetical protein